MTKHFTDSRSLNIELTSKYAAIDTPETLKVPELYPHQRIAVQALLDIEKTRKREINGSVLVSNSAILAERFGAGKTLIILALITMSKVPRKVPFTTMYAEQSVSFKLQGTRAHVTPTLIIVGTPVFEQWKIAIARFTDLRVFHINGYFEFKAFQAIYEANQINAYDIILLRNGSMTGAMPGTNLSGERNTIDVMNSLVSACWSRLIIDDYDTINIPAHVMQPIAFFTLYVSATSKTVQYKSRKPGSDLFDEFNSAVPRIMSAGLSRDLGLAFKVRSNERFLKKSMMMTSINYIRCVYANPDDNYMRMIGAIGDKEAHELMEMLNGDAVVTAAAAVGMKATSIADIFKRVLDNKYDAYTSSKAMLDHLAKVQAVIDSTDIHPAGTKHSAEVIASYRATIKKLEIPRFKYWSDHLDNLIADMRPEYEEIYKSSGAAIERMMDNISEGGCQVCRATTKDTPVFIVKCCGLVTCDRCGIRSNGVKIQYDWRVKKKHLFGTCANCRAQIVPRTDMILIDRKINIESLLLATGTETGNTLDGECDDDEEQINYEFGDEYPDEIDEISIKIETERNPKVKALLRIVRGEMPNDAQKVTVDIPMLLPGTCSIPKPTKRKTIVFASQDETLDNVETKLDEYGIPWLRLSGTAHMMHAALEKFRNGDHDVMLIASNRVCAGMNIEFATNLVFYHKLMDQNIEAQVVGRAQRIGRKCDLNVYYICYDNERGYV